MTHHRIIASGIAPRIGHDGVMGVATVIGTVQSVNVGEPRTVEWAGRSVVSSIWKSPVDGRVAVAGVNLSGDAQADLRVHGGPDKAIYTYAVEDYRWWEKELGTPLEPATFGENLTVEGIDLAHAIVGEVWSIGSARVEVAQPRMPCFKLGMRMDDAAFVERFERARRNGAYLRIVSAGDVGAGDAIERLSRPAHGVTIAFIADVFDSHDPDGMRLLVETADVPDNWRDWAARQLARATGGAT